MSQEKEGGAIEEPGETKSISGAPLRVSRSMSWNPRDMKILVVDDELTARMVSQRVLKKCGYNDVDIVESGRKALEILDKPDHGVQLVLCDLHMPDVDGIGLVEAVRSKEHIKGLPIVMLSATEDLSVVYKCLQKGADDYLLKPIQANAVKNLWQNVWRKRKEKSYDTALNDERNKRNQLDEEVEEMKKELESLKVQFDEAVETPIQVIVRTISSISKDDSLTSEVRGALSTIIKSLGSSNLYRPALTKFLEEDSDQSLDPMTREWLSNEFKFETSHRRGSTSIDSWAQVSESSEGAKQLLRSWDFDVWAYEEHDLLPYLEEMFKDFDLITRFKINTDKLRNFLIQIRNGYNKKNPYHNFRHAFDVTQACYVFLTAANAAEHLTQLEIYALLVAAVCHDFEHPGLNNTFQINTNSSMALRYNDRSVLENYHASRAFHVMRKPECNIIEGMENSEYREFRKLVIQGILATDLARHMESHGRFNQCVESFTREDREHRGLLMEILLKSADISNPTRPHSINTYWSQMVQEEFFAQGDAEKEKGLIVSPFMDRDKAGLPKMTVGFIDFFVTPLYQSLVKLLPNVNVCCERLAETRLKWATLLAQEEQKKD